LTPLSWKAWKALDPSRPIREADITETCSRPPRYCVVLGHVPFAEVRQAAAQSRCGNRRTDFGRCDESLGGETSNLGVALCASGRTGPYPCDGVSAWLQLGCMIGQPFRSRDAFGSCSLRHHAAAAAFTTAQAFDELGNWGARLDPEASEITLGDDAAVLTAQAAHHDHPTWTLCQVTHWSSSWPRGCVTSEASSRNRMPTWDPSD
jgi:hypothetical protein